MQFILLSGTAYIVQAQNFPKTHWMALKMRTVAVLLELLGGIFGWIWIAASIAAIFFLYGALANDGPWLYVLWSAVAGFVAKTIAVVLHENHRRLDYMDQLIQHGYPKSEAEAASDSANTDNSGNS